MAFYGNCLFIKRHGLFNSRAKININFFDALVGRCGSLHRWGRACVFLFRRTFPCYLVQVNLNGWCFTGVAAYCHLLQLVAPMFFSFINCFIVPRLGIVSKLCTPLFIEVSSIYWIILFDNENYSPKISLCENLSKKNMKYFQDRARNRDHIESAI